MGEGACAGIKNCEKVKPVAVPPHTAAVFFGAIVAGLASLGKPRCYRSRLVDATCYYVYPLVPDCHEKRDDQMFCDKNHPLQWHGTIDRDHMKSARGVRLSTEKVGSLNNAAE